LVRKLGHRVPRVPKDRRKLVVAIFIVVLGAMLAELALLSLSEGARIAVGVGFALVAGLTILTLVSDYRVSRKGKLPPATTAQPRSRIRPTSETFRLKNTWLRTRGFRSTADQFLTDVGGSRVEMEDTDHDPRVRQDGRTKPEEEAPAEEASEETDEEPGE
jgi:hypothetical protein